MGGTYLKNRDQIIYVGMIGHGSAKDTRLFEILDHQIAGNVMKLSIQLSPHYFVSFEIFYDPIGRTFLAPWGGGAHPHTP